MGWFAIKALGLPRYLWIVIAVVAVVTLGLWLAAIEKADDKSNQQIGRTEERLETTTEVLERTEQGNATRTEIERDVVRGSGDVLYQQCLRTARTPANCERFLPERPAAER